MKIIKMSLLFFIAILFSLNSTYAQINADCSGYRIALSFDGNDHDKDDFLASCMALAIIAEAGLQDKLVFVDYSNHIWRDKPNDNSPEEMCESVNGAIERWNYPDSTLFFEVRIPTRLQAAKERFVQEALAAYQEGERLYYILGGPMEVPYQCVSHINDLSVDNATKAAIRANITLVSHSGWNERHGCSPEKDFHSGARCWDDLTGLETKFVKIADQNSFNDDDDLNTPIYKWNWLNDMGGKYKWLFDRNPFSDKFDPSDAGMTYWVIIGRPGIGDENNPVDIRKNRNPDFYASPAKIEDLFKDGSSCSCPVISISFSANLNVIDWTTTEDLTITWTTENADSVTLNGESVPANGDKTLSITKTTMFELIAYNSSEDCQKSRFLTITVGSMTPPANTGGMTYGPNYIVWEAENTCSPLGKWQIITPSDSRYTDNGSVPPINETHLEFTGNSHSGGSANSPLEYTFTCPKTGTYRLGGRMLQRLEGKESDKCNDVYIRMAGNFTSGNNVPLHDLKTDQKFFGRGLDMWGAIIKLETHSVGYALALYNLIEGEQYTLIVSGRSQRTNIDYWLLYETTVPIVLEAKKDLAAENPEEYRPRIVKCNTFNAIDMKYTGIDGFTDAKSDKKAGMDILQIPNRLAWAAAQMIYNGMNGKAMFTLNAMQEKDGESTYKVKVNGVFVGEGTNDRIYGINIADYTIQSHAINDIGVALNFGDTIQVEFNNTTNGLVPEGNLTATARGRWANLEICIDEMGFSAQDSTAPEMPENLALEVINHKQIKLTWDEAVDAESRITLYNIYRNNIFVKSIKSDHLEYIDAGLEPQTEYTYQVSAVNFWSMESEKSAPQSTTTTADIYAPILNSFSVSNNTTLILQFDEKLDAASATTLTNYSISPDISVEDVKISKEGMTIFLTTSEHTDDMDYQLTISNIKDKSGNVIAEPIVQNYKYEDVRPVLHLTFDEMTGNVANDASGNGNNATIANASWVKGYIEGSLRFNGSGGSTVADNSLLDIENEITVSAWMNLASGSGNQNLLQKGTNYGLFQLRSSEYPVNVLNTGGSWQIFSYATKTSYFLNSWHHVAFTYDGSEVIIYVDGEIDTVISHSGTMAANNDPVGIGTNSPWNVSHFNGLMDEVLIYNAAITALQIKKIYMDDQANHTTDVNMANNQTPLEFQLLNNYPNPFNGTTNIEYSIPKKANVKLTIYNSQGQLIETLVDEKKSAGYHSIRWNASNYASGIYYYQLVSDHFSQTKKILFMK